MKCVQQLMVLIFGTIALGFVPVNAAEDDKGLIGAKLIQTPVSTAVFPVKQSLVQQTWSQLVWNPALQKLQRQRFSVRTPNALKGADPHWENTAYFRVKEAVKLTPEGIEGKGVITWHNLGAPRYGIESVVAQYQGELKRGQFHGQGRWIHETGSVYEGEWKSGLMHGQGQLTMPDGTSYTGGFLAGLFEGKGQLIKATGTVYEGDFKNGKTDGLVQVFQHGGSVFAARFVLGNEVSGSRGPARLNWPLLAQKAQASRNPKGLSLTVGAVAKMPVCCTEGPPTLGYRAIATPKELIIQPNDKSLMRIWYGKKNIVVGDPNGFGWTRSGAGEFALMNYTSSHVVPTRLVVGLKNTTRRNVSVSSAYLDVGSSRLDARPALQAIERSPYAKKSMDYLMENFGWASASNAVLDFRFVSGNGKRKSNRQRIPLGTVKGVKLFSFEQLIAKSGMSKAFLERVETECKSMNCIRSKFQNAGLGSLGKIVSFGSGKGNSTGYSLRAVGKVSYKWNNAEGKVVSSSSPFDALVRLGNLRLLAECEGGEFRRPRGFKPLNLANNKGARRIPIDIAGRVGAGKLERWQIEFQSKKSSTHRFDIVFKLADGREIRSRALKLNIFQPRPVAYDTRFNGPC